MVVTRQEKEADLLKLYDKVLEGIHSLLDGLGNEMTEKGVRLGSTFLKDNGITLDSFDEKAVTALRPTVPFGGEEVEAESEVA